MNAFSSPRNPPALALLVDGDNLSSNLAAKVLDSCQPYGTPMIRRVYGDAAKLPGWSGVPGFRLVHSGRGKNATDMLICIEAMALLHSGHAQAFAIASSDGDFSHLATHLRERGIPVIGIGEAKAPAHWLKSCNHFHQIAPTPAPAKTVATPPAAKPKVTAQPQAQDLLDRIADLLREAAPDALPLSRLGHALPGLLAQSGHASWSKFLRAHPTRFDLDLSCPGGQVRLIRG
ncbi:NYN domain-containing protein [Gemmobacter serpentinus]|uniref:NYN domain-containing protein n=1 Tax=Gemmobacter serpentinus TaxID=2652247 RepID=UPI00124EF9E0|nr:NYN domain-containing protein [Gemmobacter serpentinus]